MDLETLCPTPEFVEDKEPTQLATTSHVDDNMIKDNHGYNIMDTGSSANDYDNHVIVKGAAVDKVVQPMHSSSSLAKSPSPTSKGYGLKKWRRIKRDFVKDPSPSATMDTSKMLKRGLSTSANPTKHQHMTSPENEINQNINSETPVGQVNMLKNPSLGLGHGNGFFMMQSPNLDSKEAAFSAVTDSENSKDLSSKSLTAAVLGFVHEENQMKNLSVGNSSQRVQQIKGGAESSKKHRGERVKIEKENSYSSLESDSRSSNFVFMETLFSVTSNGKQNGKSMNYDGDNSDEADGGEHLISEQVQTAYGKENMEEKNGNHLSPPDQDPLVHSILALQSVQEALQNEVQKLREIGKEPTSLHDDSVYINGATVRANPETGETSSSDRLASERIRKSTSGSLQTQVFTLDQKVKYLESKLEEARAILQAKETKIFELATSINSSRSHKEESGSTVGLQQDKYREMEFDLEGLFQQKMEAEIEVLALTMALQKLRVYAGNQIILCEEQTSSAGEQAQMVNKLRDPESNAAMLKKQALKKCCGDVLGTEEVLGMQRRVCKVTSCFFTQLVCLVLALWFVVSQLLPHSRVVVPT